LVGLPRLVVFRDAREHLFGLLGIFLKPDPQADAADGIKELLNSKPLDLGPAQHLSAQTGRKPAQIVEVLVSDLENGTNALPDRLKSLRVGGGGCFN
jgi:hypothetical protein